MNIALPTTRVAALIAAGVFLVLLSAQPVFAQQGTPNVRTANGCVTPWGNKPIAHGQTVPYQPYFSNGVLSLTVVVPLMRCNNGTWSRCDYRGNNCMPIANTQRATSTNDKPIRSEPIPLPRVPKSDRSDPIPLPRTPYTLNSTSTPNDSHPCTVTPLSSRSGRVVANIPCGPEINAENWGRIASTTRAHFLEQAQKLLKNRQNNEQKRQDRLSKLEKKVSGTNFRAIKSIIERLGDAHDKLSNLLVKIEESLAKAAAAGKDVTAAQTATTQAENDLVAAQTAIDAVQTVMDTATASGAQIKDHIGGIRTAVTTAVEKIRTANTSVTAALKAARTATGTSSTSSYGGGWQQ